MPAIDFYDNANSPCARRVRITLEEKAVPYQSRLIDLTRAEQKSDWFLAINPLGKVPAIAVDGRPLWESNIITQYLDDVFPGEPLYPTDPQEYAEVRRWQEFELVFAKRYFMLMYQRLFGAMMRTSRGYEAFMAEVRARSSDPAFIRFEERAYKGETLSPEEESACEAYLRDCMERVNEALHHSDYLVGKRFTQADISVYPRFRMLPYLQIYPDPVRHKPMLDWMRRLERRHSIRRSLSMIDRLLSFRPLVEALYRADPLRGVPDGQQSPVQKLQSMILRVVCRMDPNGPDKLIAAIGNRRRALLRTLPASPQAPAAGATHWPAAVQFFHDPMNPDSRTALALLDALGATFQRIDIDVALGEHLAKSKLPATAQGALPCLQAGKLVLTGLPVIVDYLYRAQPAQAGQLLPQEPYLRAMARIHVAGDADGHFKYLRSAYEQQVLGPVLREHGDWNAVAEQLRANGTDAVTFSRREQAHARSLCDANEIQGAIDHIRDRLQDLERALADNGDYLAGVRSAADIAALERLRSWQQIGATINAKSLPRVHAWQQRMTTGNRETQAASMAG